MAKVQVLSNETVNSYGYVVLNSGLDWSRYRKNPVLYNEHRYDEVVGKVKNIRNKNGNWIGELVFADTELGRSLQRLYDAGFLRGASIGGDADIATKNGKKYATKFSVYEISVTGLPSNPDAISLELDKLSAISDDEKEAKIVAQTSYCDVHIRNERHVELSAAAEKMIDEFESNQMEGDETKKSKTLKERASEAMETIRSLLSIDEPETAREEDAPAPVEEVLSAEPEAEAQTYDAPAQLAADPDDDDDEDDPDDDKDDDDDDDKLKAGQELPKVIKDIIEKNSAEVETQNTAEVVEQAPARVADINKFKSTKVVSMNQFQTVREYLASDEGQHKHKLMARVTSPRSASEKEALHVDDVNKAIEYGKEFATLVANDPEMKVLTNNLRFDLTGMNGQRTVGSLGQVCAKLASATPTFHPGTYDFLETPDLAAIEWIPVIFRKLFPLDYWADEITRISVPNAAGVVWVNLDADPEIYFGRTTPRNACPPYEYDDTAVSLAMYVTSIQPMIWRPMDDRLLRYDKRETGIYTAMRKASVAMHNYWMYRFAVDANMGVKMSGPDTFDAAGKFPSNPNAAGTLQKFNLADIIAIQTALVNQNMDMDDERIIMSIPGTFWGQIQTSGLAQSLLTRGYDQTSPMNIDYMNVRMMPRSSTVLYNTATSTVIDSGNYGKILDNDNMIPADTPAVELPATAYDMGVAFLPSQVVVAIGPTVVIVAPNTCQYGYDFSAAIAHGAAAGRKNGLGIVRVEPAAAAASGA